MTKTINKNKVSEETRAEQVNILHLKYRQQFSNKIVNELT